MLILGFLEIVLNPYNIFHTLINNSQNDLERFIFILALERTNYLLCFISDSSVDSRNTDTVLIHLKKSHVAVFSCGYLSSFHITRSNECQQNYLVSLTRDIMCYYYNLQFFYYLDCSGIVCIL